MVALEKHYRVKELAERWGLSINTVRRMFINEPDVLRLEDGHKRRYATVSIPESVALRVHERFTNKSLQSSLAGGNPLRVVHLRHLNRGVTEKARHIVKLEACK